MSFIYIGLGSNIGNRQANLEQAVSHIALEAGDVLSISSFYRSKPWGFDSENDFLNGVILITTELTPLELLERIQAIERKMGREEKAEHRYSDRIIDIDILLYDNKIINIPGLTIPHKHLHQRDFVLIPLAEIASGLVHPVIGKTIKELAEAAGNNTVILHG